MEDYSKGRGQLGHFMAPHYCGRALIHMDVWTTVLFLLAAGLLLEIIHIVALMNGSNAE